MIRQLSVLMFLLSGTAVAQDAGIVSVQDANKALARGFYDDLWGSNNTDRYVDYMAETYIAHDIGDRKNVREPAVEQKNIADFFWANGEISIEYDYQLAEGDLVATRWTMDYRPNTLFRRVFLGEAKIPIINVFRFEDGKIVELWNHRHDIDTGQTLRFTLTGFAFGILFMVIPMFLLRRRWRRQAFAPQG